MKHAGLDKFFELHEDHEAVYRYIITFLTSDYPIHYSEPQLGEISQTFDDLTNILQENPDKCAYALINVDWRILLLVWVPETVPVKHKMISCSLQSEIIKKCQESAYFTAVTDATDFLELIYVPDVA